MKYYQLSPCGGTQNSYREQQKLFMRACIVDVRVKRNGTGFHMPLRHPALRKTMPICDIMADHAAIPAPGTPEALNDKSMSRTR